jgi:succinoglycan biosynthesis protein ExoA
MKGKRHEEAAVYADGNLRAPGVLGDDDRVADKGSTAIVTRYHSDFSPSVSVIIPVLNEEVGIGSAIERLLGQDFPLDQLEILVVDGGSSDHTRDIVAELQRTHPHALLRLLHNEAGIVPSALNIAIRWARSRIIIRMDGHTVPSEDYVSSCVRALEVSGAANVGGYWSSQGTTAFGNAVARATAHSLGMGNARYRAGGEAADVDTVPFGAFRRDVFKKVGLFDESMVRNQDYEMNVRIREAGERVRFDPSIRFTYTPRGSVGALWRQYFQYGWWRVETVRRHPKSLRPRQVVAPLFVACLLGLIVLAPMSALAVAALVTLLTIYLGTVVAGALQGGRHDASPHLVALAFTVIHMSFGLGFILNVASGGTFPYRAGPPRVPRLEDDDGAAPPPGDAPAHHVAPERA